MSEFFELIKNMRRVRKYIRNFYIFGWKTRADYTEKSPRSYDNERRRIESWLKRYVRRNRGENGSSVSISLNMLNESRNPLYEIWRTKSFTTNDLRLHFHLLDICSSENAYTAEELADEISERYDEVVDISTLRKKLREYETCGILISRREGKKRLYARETLTFRQLPRAMTNAVNFFTEAAPFGVIGSFIQDENDFENQFFRFKHHFVAHTLDDEILLALLSAIAGKMSVRLTLSDSSRLKNISAIPLKILTGTQSGRRYVAIHRKGAFSTSRIDRIDEVIQEAPVDADTFDRLERELEETIAMSWGVVLNRGKTIPDRVELTLRIDEHREKYVLDRIEREGRHGTIEPLDSNTFLYRIDVWDATEMLPFIKSLTGRIVSFKSNNRTAVKRFYQDMERMHNMYLGNNAEGANAHEE